MILTIPMPNRLIKDKFCDKLLPYVVAIYHQSNGKLIDYQINSRISHHEAIVWDQSTYDYIKQKIYQDIKERVFGLHQAKDLGVVMSSMSVDKDGKLL